MPTLNDAEARVLGVLIEKSLTTPDSYPLSINAALNACNQKSNRFPVTSFVEAEVVVALQGLVPKHLAGRVMDAGGRVEKFRHTAGNALGLGDPYLCILAELLMRGPQSAAELRARVARMVATPNLAELNERLDVLVERKMVAHIAPAPGSRAGRLVQLLAPGLHALEPVVETGADPAVEPRPGSAPAATLGTRVEALESDLATLRTEFDQLRRALGN